MTTPLVARAKPEPTPREIASGIMPATKAIVVIKIGRSRSLLACRIACVALHALVRAGCWCGRPAGSSSSSRRRTSTSRPSAVKMLSDWWKRISDSSANGIVSGRQSRIVIGCSHDSNCAASTRYMKTNDSAKASTKFIAARPVSRERPCGARLVARRQVQVGDDLRRARAARRSRRSRARRWPAPPPGAGG